MIGLGWTTIASAEDLKDALAAAYTSNPELLAQRAALRSIDELSARANAGFLPRASASGGYGESTIDRVGEILNTKTNNKSYSARVDQSIFNGFRDVNTKTQAKSVINANRAQLASVEQRILLDTVTAYMNVVRDQAVLELTQNNVDVLTRQLEASRDRFRVGEVTRTDVAQSEARLAGSVSNRITSEAALSTSRAEYRRVVGDNPGTLIQPEPLTGLPATLEEATAISLSENPNITIARSNEEAAGYDVKRSFGGMLPTVDAYVSISKNDGQQSFASQVFDNNQTQKAIGFSVRIPLYQGGAEYSDIRRAKHIRSQRRMDIIATERGVRSTVRNAWGQYRASVASIDSSNAQVNANQIALDGVRQEATVGSRTTLDVLDAEQELLDSRVNLVRAQRNEYVAGYSLISATGRLNAKQLEIDVELYNPEKNYKDVRYKVLGWDTNK
jgi:TolC family type I secretion outer membrane protein